MVVVRKKVLFSAGSARVELLESGMSVFYL